MISGANGKVAVVTGASSGIGKATVDCLVSAGVKVAAADLAFPTAPDHADRAPAMSEVVDVSQEEEVIRFFSKVEKQLGPVSILANCAGVVRRLSILQTSVADWDYMINTNLKGTFLCCREALRQMQKHRNGIIINVASELAVVAGPLTSSYAASKAGVVQLTRAIALEHGRDGVRANCVCPGPVDTPMLQAATASDGNPTAKHQANIDATILGRIGRPEEIASVIAFLASDASSFMTGSVVMADGGVSAK